MSSDDQKCESKCLPGIGCRPVIQMEKDFSAFIQTATKGMADHQEISEMVWQQAKQDISELIDNTKECFSNFNDAALELQKGSQVMEILRKDIDSVAEYARETKKEIKDDLERECNLKEIELKWLRRGIYVSLFGHGVTIVFLMITHPQFLNVLAKLLGIG